MKWMGKLVVVVFLDMYLGGFFFGGLGWIDMGNKVVIGGIV